VALSRDPSTVEEPIRESAAMTRDEALNALDALTGAMFTTTITAVPLTEHDPQDPLDDDGMHFNVSVGTVTFKHNDIKRLLEVCEANGLMAHSSSFDRGGDFRILTDREARNMFPSHHKPIFPLP
jgi:hypothetical protein